MEERRKYGTFYYRFPGGEAASDVYDRINDFLGSMHRDMSSPDFPQNCVLVTHSLAIRLFLMRWFHLTVEDFEAMKSPQNAQLIVMEYNPATEQYELKTPLATDPDSVLRSRPIKLDNI
jgi:broad specificity phosphatase PhoE